MPYPESVKPYFQYEVMKDITEKNVKDAYNSATQEVKRQIDRVMEKWELSFEDLACPQQGEVATVFGTGGGKQIKFTTNIKYYEILELIKEVK